jgi:hypothetical protein
MQGTNLAIRIPVGKLAVWCLVAAGATLASCAGSHGGAATCDAQVEAGEIAGLSVEGETERVHYCFSVPEGTGLTEVEIETHIVDGRVGWTLRDPSGDVRWSDEVEGWNLVKSTNQFETEAGMWAFEVAVDRLDGGYHWSWGPEPLDRARESGQAAGASWPR